MEELNQYYSDVTEDANIVPSKFFNKNIYKDINFHVNNYKKYKSKEYYTWIQKNFSKD